MRALSLCLLTAVGAAGCAKGDALVVVAVDTTVQLDNIASFGGTATANGKNGAITFPSSVTLPTTLSPGNEFTFGVRVPVGDVGPFSITLSALDAMGRPLQTTTDGTTTSAGQVAHVTLRFGVVNTDAGDDGMDGGTCPKTCEEAGVGCGQVTTSCGLMITCPKACSVNAVEPVVGRSGDTITLEGRFGANTMVNFTGGVSAPATLLGAERATVKVPNGAITGPLSITVNGMTPFGAVDFKITTFVLGLGNWNNTYPQADAARLVPQLRVDRSQHAVLAVGKVVLALGGVSATAGPGGTALNSFETAGVNADGTLQSFNLWATTGTNARSLVTGRVGLSALRVGGTVVVLGGNDNATTVYNSVEHADVNGDGSGIQSFVANATSMNTGRYLSAAKVIGDYVYVFGGFVSGSIYDVTAVATDTVERAPILVKGLGPFETVPSKLMTPRGGAAVEVIGNTVYVMGGVNTGFGVLSSIEQATINGDGSIGPFTVSSTSLDTGRGVASSFVAGGHLFLIGGVGITPPKTSPDNVATMSISQIQPDGSLGPFNTSPGVMTRQRAAAGQGVVVGNNYYLIGGGGGGGGGTNVIDLEYTSLNVSGDIGAFAPYSKTTNGHRTLPASVVFGDHLYLFGGQTSDTTTIESAPISPDGTLGAFTTLGASLSTARGGAFVAVLGNQIFVYGGQTNVSSVDVFNVQPDGTLMSASSGQSMMFGRTAFQMVAIPNPAGGGTLYAVGGDGSAAGTDTSVDHIALDAMNGYPMGGFTGATGLLPSAHSNVAGALIGGSYYLFGIFNSMTGATDEAKLDGAGGLNAFAASTNGILTHNRWGGPLVWLGPRMLLYGGFHVMVSNVLDSSTDAIPTVLNGMGATQLGTSFMNLAGSAPVMARRGAVATALGNYVYVLGGYSNTDLNSIEVAALK